MAALMVLWLKLLVFMVLFIGWVCVQILIICYANREARKSVSESPPRKFDSWR